MLASVTSSWRAKNDELNDATSRLTFAYIIALSLIAILSMSAHFLVDMTIDEHKDSSTVINIAGRQRMLSQRTALLAEDIRLGDASAREPLRNAVNLMEQSHDALIHRDDLGVNSPLYPEAASLYFTGPMPLDRMVRLYISDLREFMQMAPGQERDQKYDDLHKMALNTLLPALDQAVLLFAKEADGNIAKILFEQKCILLVLIVTLFLEALLIFRPMVRRIERYQQQLFRQASFDSLTNLPNRRYFFDAGERFFQLARRVNQPMSALVVDLDTFKTINDSWGHATGDLVLIRFGEIMQTTLRSSDLIGRIGGEEFAVLLPNTDAKAACEVAEKLRHLVESDHQDKYPAFTISIGVTELDRSDAGLPELLRRADAATYMAKMGGRNQVAVNLATNQDAKMTSLNKSKLVPRDRQAIA